MKNKLKPALSIIIAILLSSTLLLANAFYLKPENINNNFTVNSYYKGKDAIKVTVLEKTVSFEEDSTGAKTIQSIISENIEAEALNLYKKYKSEVLGNTGTTITPDAGATVTVATSPAALNNYELTVLNLINNIRVSNGLNVLQSSQTLTDIARLRCNDMITNSYFSHYTPDGRNIFNIYRENRVSYKNGGENLAQSSPASTGTPEAFINAWMASPAHKANILRPEYNKIGIGVDEGGDRRVVAIVFTN
ncbi:MAG: CAP domain-containing protein [Actinomycetota bacterium]|nr:CAP domain-containing protein [Actinomycetota bacterium]